VPLNVSFRQNETYSQFGQDLFLTQHVYPALRGGFFLEMGAGDGLYISNTLLLERTRGWKGILIEPTSMFEKLKINRPGCICDNSVIASEEKDVTLFEVMDRGQAQLNDAAKENSLLSFIAEAGANEAAVPRDNPYAQVQSRITRKAVPLQQVLRKYSAPAIIDYFSLDVEGAEWEVLRAFPFDEFSFRCMTIEKPTEELDQLLMKHGYQAIHVMTQDVLYEGPKFETGAR
jgi:hypothetical protein